MRDSNIVMVTGSNGQLGWEIQQLANDIENVQFEFFNRTTLDVTDFEKVADTIDKVKPQYVVNCAAYTAVDNAEDDVEMATLINAEAVGNMAKHCEKVNAVLIHISTDYVFDGKSNLPYKPFDECNPLGVYGKSKLNGERLISKFMERAIIIRTSWVYSSHGKNFVKTMLRLGKDKNEISVVADQFGSPTYARDLGRAILALVVNGVQPHNIEIQHFTNYGICTWAQFAQKIFEIEKLNCEVKEITTDDFPTKAKRPAYSVLNSDDFTKKYGFVKNNPWQDALAECLSQIN